MFDVRDQALNCIGMIDVLMSWDRLGPAPDQPYLVLNQLHDWVWDAAKSFWASDHRSQGAERAWKSINAPLQQGVGRRDISDGVLVNGALSPPLPTGAKAKLRVKGDPTEQSWM